MKNNEGSDTRLSLKPEPCQFFSFFRILSSMAFNPFAVTTTDSHHANAKHGLHPTFWGYMCVAFSRLTEKAQSCGGLCEERTPRPTSSITVPGLPTTRWSTLQFLFSVVVVRSSSVIYIPFQFQMGSESPGILQVADGFRFKDEPWEL